MIQTQTYSLPETEEVETIAAALQLLHEKRHDEAMKVLAKRHDQLTTKEPKLRLYGT